MNIVCINTVHNGSTGTIMRQVADCARQQGHSVTTFSTYGFSFSLKPPRVSKPEILPELPGHRYYGSYLSKAFHTFAGIFTGGNGCFSGFATAKLLREIDRLQPDLIHLHNLHGFCINLPMLFGYIKKKKIKVIWTLHDCWSFTGHCPHFQGIGCEKWKTHCHHCPLYRGYPVSYTDNSRWMFDKKRKWFTGVEDLTLVTPSQWLADIVKQSFLKEYPVQVIHNGIDLSVFRPTPSDFRKNYACQNKFLLLSVAAGWDERKGLDVLIELSQRLDPEIFQIILVGTDDLVDQQLPSQIISIHRTENPRQLAEIYTAADLFVNPTREDNFPSTNVEALACGTPVITYRTGGSPEAVTPSCGQVIEKGDLEQLEFSIREIQKNRPFSTQACVSRGKQFDKYEKFGEYVSLYE